MDSNMRDKITFILNSFNDRGVLSTLLSSKDYLWEYHILRRVQDKHHQIKYDVAAPKPDQLLLVNLNNINYKIRPNFYSKLSPYRTYILAGEWDKKSTDNEHVLEELDQYWRYHSLKNHFEDGVPWEDTEIYEKMLEVSRWKGSKKQVQGRLCYLDKLYNSMKEKGYKTQRELLMEDENVPKKVRYPQPEYHEVAINIGRNGELILDEGRHRVSIAKILGIEKIPVRVLVRHKKWQETKYNVYTQMHSSPKSLKERYKNHPDINLNRTHDRDLRKDSS
ncbi:hypothetical protein [Natronorubrum sp. A-ect3]|uniref:hypothetical protein n=1 Tax=Natronorubrum sp. A-ect3 TaxID=3242698 RepID=UPI00359D0E47